MELVSVAVAGDLMVVSCAPGWTERDYVTATSPYRHLEAHLAGLTDEADGTEILIFEVLREEAA
jgi:hypothetical protein